jgi:superfamily II DNA/RNA helicase
LFLQLFQILNVITNIIHHFNFRIGRTGRRDKTGTAYTLFTPTNSVKAKDLMDVLIEAKQVVNPKLQEMAQCAGFNRRAGGGRYGGGGGSGRFSGGSGRYKQF